MYSKINSAAGFCHVRVRGAMTESFLNRCFQSGVTVIDVIRASEIEIELRVKSEDYAAIQAEAEKSCCETELIKRVGRGNWLSFLKRRIFPAMLALGLVALLFWSRFFVWEIDILGCENISEGEVLSALADCGVECGAFWPDFSADSIRNRVLLLKPELSWVTVNMHGSRAEVIVVERDFPPEIVTEREACDIVAGRGGFVTNVNVLQGEGLVRSGNTVNKGDVLISGIVESSFSPPRFLTSLGSVEAEINRLDTAVMPITECRKEYTGKIKHKYALIIGNNRINFYSDSSISDAFCDKIISVWKFGIEELFSIPLSIVRETQQIYEIRSVERDAFEAGVLLEAAVCSFRDLDTPDAVILYEKPVFGESRGCYTSSLHTRCLCEIGISAPISAERKAEAEEKVTEKDDK